MQMGGSSSSSKLKSISAWNQEQRNIFSLLSGGTTGKNGIYGGLEGENGETAVTSYPGELYTPTTPEEKSYFAQIANMQPAREEALKQTLSGKVPYEIGPEWAEKFYQESVRPMAMEEWKKIAEPAIREAYAGPGYWGSARAGAQAEGAQDLAMTLASQRAGLMYGEEQAKRAATEAALTRQATYGPAAAATEAEIMGTAGDRTRAIAQEKNLAEYQRWLTGEEVEGESVFAYSPYVQLAFQLLGLEPYISGVASKSQSFGGGIGG